MPVIDPYNSPGLFVLERACVSCGRKYPAQEHARTAVPLIAISMVVYRRGKGKPALKAAGKVQMCEACFVLMLSTLGAPGKETKALLRAMVEKLSPVYIEMLSDDEAQAEAKSSPCEAQCSL